VIERRLVQARQAQNDKQQRRMKADVIASSRDFFKPKTTTRVRLPASRSPGSP